MVSIWIIVVNPFFFLFTVRDIEDEKSATYFFLFV